jgi:hypothetical protein
MKKRPVQMPVNGGLYFAYLEILEKYNALLSGGFCGVCLAPESFPIFPSALPSLMPTLK